jgi:hypothetical protein
MGLNMDTNLLLKVVRISLKLVVARVLTILALSMTFALACWTMWGPSYERIAALLIFAITVFLPSLMKETKHDDDDESGEQTGGAKA